MVSILKLTSGAEIVGELLASSDEGYSVKNPLLIYYRHRLDSAMPSAGLTRYSPFSKQEKVNFRHEHVINILDPIPEMKAYYFVALKGIVDAMDKNVESELSSIRDEESSNENDAKLAMLERMATKARLN